MAAEHLVVIEMGGTTVSVSTLVDRINERAPAAGARIFDQFPSRPNRNGDTFPTTVIEWDNSAIRNTAVHGMAADRGFITNTQSPAQTELEARFRAPSPRTAATPTQAGTGNS